MKVWAFEVCLCEYETGWNVRSLHSTKEQAEKAMHELMEREVYVNEGGAEDYVSDGYRVIEWSVEQ